jgi:hypothetical protein
MIMSHVSDSVICVVYRECESKFTMPNNLKSCSQQEWKKENQHTLTTPTTTRFSEVEQKNCLIFYVRILLRR